jgi:hypothetical protein
MFWCREGLDQKVSGKVRKDNVDCDDCPVEAGSNGIRLFALGYPILVAPNLERQCGDFDFC